MGFDLDPEARRRLGYKLIDRVNDYFASLPDRSVQVPADQRTYGALSGAMPEVGDDADRVFDDICREMVEQGFHISSANYFGLMNPAPTYMAFLAEALVAALNPQIATLARSQLASKIERQTVRWIGERVGWPGDFDGTFTSGGNEANFSGIALALASAFPESVENGVASIGAPPVLYASDESHHSLDKSAGLLGLGRKALRRIPVNERLQMDPAKLEAAIQRDRAAGHHPFCVIATAGTTNSGAIDDLVSTAAICARHHLWLHVDGAYAASAIFSDQHRNLLTGIERADSITLDPHKWLAMPFAAGVILTRHPSILEQAFGVYAPYMPKAEGAKLPDNSRISTQWSRRMNALKLWLTLRVHGRQAYEEHIDRQLRLAHSFADWVRKSDSFELTVDPTVPIVNFRIKSAGRTEADVAAANNAIVEAVTADGRRWISETKVAGRSVIRMMVISYLTDEGHLRALQESLSRAVEAVLPRFAAARSS